METFYLTDTGLVRDHNEDSVIVLTNSDNATLMAVADGMGGQNAGEVASAIAIETVQTMFAPNCLTDKVLSKPANIKDYLKKVVSKADINVKEYSKEHPEAEGLGSTIVIAWVIGDRVYIAWLGDSRAYALVSGQGIKHVS